jgi:trans-2,3-dihydro-3-hydroxyanthranilate isomerase
MEGVRAAIVDACLRDDAGGSPTGVVIADGLSVASCRALPGRWGTSHVGVVARAPVDGAWPVRFFTADAELAGCGHGTIAVHALLNDSRSAGETSSAQITGGRRFEVRSRARGDALEVWFDQGTVTVRAAEPHAAGEAAEALGLAAGELAIGDPPVVASPGTPRLLLAVAERESLWSARPDLERLAELCRRNGWLGCFLYHRVGARADRRARAAARMFAPAIGVSEDVANANSAGCLAAHLTATGREDLVEVDQGDALGRPSRIWARANQAGRVWLTWVGGLARVAHEVTVPPLPVT